MPLRCSARAQSGGAGPFTIMWATSIELSLMRMSKDLQFLCRKSLIISFQLSSYLVIPTKSFEVGNASTDRKQSYQRFASTTCWRHSRIICSGDLRFRSLSGGLGPPVTKLILEIFETERWRTIARMKAARFRISHFVGVWVIGSAVLAVWQGPASPLVTSKSRGSTGS